LEELTVYDALFAKEELSANHAHDDVAFWKENEAV
jgi:hypothetical protein